MKRLLIRAPNWIGDAVMSEPAIRHFRATYPDARVTVLARPAIAELLAAHPAIDERIVYDPRRYMGLSGKWRLAEELRNRRFDGAVLLQNAFEAALIAFLARIPFRYGYATDGRQWLLTRSLKPAPRAAGQPLVSYYLDLAAALGPASEMPPPRLYLSAEERQEADALLAEFGIGPDESIIGLNPGSTNGGAKRWLPERFAETAERLAQSTGSRIVIVGAPGEEALASLIASRVSGHAAVLSGRTTIRQLMAVTARCRLFVTNDTGPMHIAAAFGVPLVAIFGPSDAAVTGPYGHGHAVVRHPVECAPCLLKECPIDHRCMTGVTVDAAVSVASRLLSGGSSEPSAPSESAATSGRCLEGITVFLDRDGTLNADTGYVKDAADLHLLPGAGRAVAALNAAGARVVLITNQSGIARGYLTLDGLKQIHARLRELLAADGAGLDAIYFCPHHPDEQCACRKPNTAMIDRAVADLGIDLGRSYLIGDQARDLELARAVGVRSILVLTGPTSRQAMAGSETGVRPDHVASDLEEAAAWILAEESVNVGSEP